MARHLQDPKFGMKSRARQVSECKDKDAHRGFELAVRDTAADLGTEEPRPVEESALALHLDVDLPAILEFYAQVKPPGFVVG